MAAGTGSAKYKDEIIALFSSVEIRDAVRRAAKELGGTRDAGIRLEIPFNLQSSLKALEAVSYQLKQKNQGVKRNIKFDDSDMDLVLDFNVDPEGSGVWKWVSATQAKQMKQKINSAAGQSSLLSNDELGSLMDIA